jgi:hypothetical protein
MVSKDNNSIFHIFQSRHEEKGLVWSREFFRDLGSGMEMTDVDWSLASRVCSLLSRFSEPSSSSVSMKETKNILQIYHERIIERI